MGVTLPVEFRRATLAEIVDLRHRILRAGLPRETAIFPGDDAPTTLHLGAFADGTCIACATFHLNQFEGEPAWQLRGMATEEGYRGTGVGRRMLQAAEAALGADDGIRLLWCNARVPARGFYEKQGWAAVSEEFDIPTAGPHVRMRRRMQPLN